MAAAKRLLDVAKDQRLAFERIAPGEDGPLRGVRDTLEWRNEIYLAGFWAPASCTAIRRRRSSLIVPGGLPIAARVSRDALTVLHTVLCDAHSVRRAQRQKRTFALGNSPCMTMSP